MQIKLKKSQIVHHRIIMKQLKVKQKDKGRKYLKKDKGRKLLMIQDSYNNKITEYQKVINLLDNIPNQTSTLKK